MIWIVAIILLLYLRTYKHGNLIDDTCNRGSYLKEETDEVPIPEGFWDKRRPYGVTFQCVGIFILTCWSIYINFGFWPALLYSVFPLNVSGVAWKIGSYLYMTTTFFLMVSWYFIFTADYWGILIALPFYWVALKCSLPALSFPFIVTILTRNPYTLILYIPLILFLTGKRFRKGFKKRYSKHDKLNKQADWRRIIPMIKVMAYYPTLLIWPKDGFFHDFGHHAHNYWIDRLFFLCILMNISFLAFGIFVDWEMYLAYILSIGIYSQILCLGMFIAVRYTFHANVFWCVLVAKYFSTYFPQALPVIAALWGYHTYLIVPNFRSNEALFRWSWQKQGYCSENSNNLASEYMSKKRWDLAIAPLLWSLKYSPPNSLGLVYFNLAQCYGNVAEFKKALYYIREAKKHNLPTLTAAMDDIEIKCLNHARMMEENRKHFDKIMKKYKD